MKIHSLPYGQPLGAELNSRQTPVFLGFFAGSFGCVTPLSASGSMGLFPFPTPNRWDDWASSTENLNGSARELGPGKHDMYCHGSPHVQARSAEAASSIRNWMSYSSQASWLDAFCWRRSTVCKWATMLGTISAAFLDSTAM